MGSKWWCTSAKAKAKREAREPERQEARDKRRIWSCQGVQPLSIVRCACCCNEEEESFHLCKHRKEGQAWPLPVKRNSSGAGHSPRVAALGRLLTSPQHLLLHMALDRVQEPTLTQTQSPSTTTGESSIGLLLLRMGVRMLWRAVGVSLTIRRTVTSRRNISRRARSKTWLR